MSPSYSGAAATVEAKELLGQALGALQEDPSPPSEVSQVTQSIAEAVRALFSAQQVDSEAAAEQCVRNALSSLSQTLILLQEVRGSYAGVTLATQTIAKAVSTLYPLLAKSPIEQGTKRASGEFRVQSILTSSNEKQNVPPMQRHQVNAEVGAATETNFYVGFSGEISEGGLFVATYVVLDLGALVDLRLMLPGGFVLSLPGTVQFVRDPVDFSSGAEPGMGVKFDRLSKDDRELILRYVWKRAPMFYED